MSKGVVIYAYNSTFNYVKAAEFAAKQARKFLGLPTTLITDVMPDSDAFDDVIIAQNNAPEAIRSIRLPNGSVEMDWRNQTRSSAYDLSPYDQTLLIDADYFMFNSSLKPVFESNLEFACYDEIVDVTLLTHPQQRLSPVTQQMCWATVVYFTKCEYAKAVFEMMETIRDNWKYYAMLYNFRVEMFRNDYALTIALHALNGFNGEYARLPGKLHSAFSNVDVTKVRIEDDSVTIVLEWSNGLTMIKDTNLHVMNKVAMEKFYE